MSANIEIRLGKASYVENGKKERAWHRLGQVYDTPLTVKEAIEGCNANFEVGLQPVIAADPQLENLLSGNLALDSDTTKLIDGKQFVSVESLKRLIIEGRKATMRYDYNEPLAIVSDQYGVVQYQKAFEFVDLITTGQLGGDVPTIECAGLLGTHGERIFITAKFPEPIVIGNKDDVIDQYLVFTTSHDSTSAVTVMTTNVRVVCNNTLNLALSNNSGKITFRHTSRVNERLDLMNKENAEMAYKALHLFNTYNTYFKESLEQLSKIKLSDKEQEKILAKALFTPDVWKVYEASDYNLNNDDIGTRSRNILEGVTNAIYTGIGQNSLENNTGLKLVNGISCFYQNVAGWKDDNEKKFNAIMEGSVQKKLQTAYELVLKVA